MTSADSSVVGSGFVPPRRVRRSHRTDDVASTCVGGRALRSPLCTPGRLCSPGRRRAGQELPRRRGARAVAIHQARTLVAPAGWCCTGAGTSARRAVEHLASADAHRGGGSRCRVARGRRPRCDRCDRRRVQSRRTTPDRLRRVLAARARIGRRDLLSAVLDDVAAGACSVLERAYLRDVERAHALPRASRARGVSRGRIYRDVRYDRHRLLVELDGRLGHTSSADRDRDLDRDLDAAVTDAATTVRLGYGQVRTTVPHRGPGRRSPATRRLDGQPQAVHGVRGRTGWLSGRLVTAGPPSRYAGSSVLGSTSFSSSSAPRAARSRRGPPRRRPGPIWLVGGGRGKSSLSRSTRRPARRGPRPAGRPAGLWLSGLSSRAAPLVAGRARWRRSRRRSRASRRPRTRRGLGSVSGVGSVGLSGRSGPGSGSRRGVATGLWRSGARAMSSRLPSRSSRAPLALPTPAAILSVCLPPVFLSIAPPALSRPSLILSPCLSTASPSFFLASSRKPTACPPCVGRPPGRRTRRRPCQTSHRVHPGPSPCPVVAVVGATASGKSALALDLAERLGGEIVNTDSMQVYRGMDVGTAKLPPGERRGITHHLMDVLEVTEPATVAEFQGWARAVDRGLPRPRSFARAGGRVGALHPRDPRRVRVPGHRSRRTQPARGGARRGRLRSAARAARRASTRRPPAQVLPSNGRRVVRALEVVEITGRPFIATLPEQRYHYAGAVQVGVDIDRETLDRRIEQRVEQMWAAGIRRRGPRPGRRTASARGVRRAGRWATSRSWPSSTASITEDEAREQTVTGTRRFARRQDSWFRKDPRITWVRVRRPRARGAGALDGAQLSRSSSARQVAHRDQRREHHRQRGEHDAEGRDPEHRAQRRRRGRARRRGSCRSASRPRR